MGNCIYSLATSLNYLTKVIKEKCVYMLTPKRKTNNHPLILLKDDEQHATIMSSEEINNMIQKHQQSENLPPNNLNEYKIITSSNDDEDNLVDKEEKIKNELIQKDIEEIKKEVNTIEIEPDEDVKETNNEEGNEAENNNEKTEDFDQLKNDIFNVNDE